MWQFEDCSQKENHPDSSSSADDTRLTVYGFAAFDANDLSLIQDPEVFWIIASFRSPAGASLSLFRLHLCCCASLTHTSLPHHVPSSQQRSHEAADLTWQLPLRGIVPVQSEIRLARLIISSKISLQLLSLSLPGLLPNSHRVRDAPAEYTVPQTVDLRPDSLGWPGRLWRGDRGECRPCLVDVQLNTPICLLLDSL